MTPSRLKRHGAFSIDTAALAAPLLLRYPGFPDALRLLAALAFFGVVGYQVWLLSARGQTLGKRAVGLKIVRADDGGEGGFLRNVALRSLVGRWLLAIVPFYWIADSLFVFRGDGRCVHDLIAGTRVVALE